MADNNSNKSQITNGNSGGSPEKSVSIEDLPINITRSTYAKVSTIVVLLLFAVSATWTFAQLTINQKNSIIEIKDKDLAIKKEAADELNNKYLTLHESYKEIKKLSKVPTLLSPVAGKHISGRFITFRWKYDVNPGFQNFILELRHINRKNESLVRRYQIPDASRKEMDFELPANTEGEFYWRIGTGEMLTTDYSNVSNEDKNIAKIIVDSSLKKTKYNSIQADTHLWSRYGHFNVHNSVFDKIKNTGELSVGMTATFLSYDHTIDCQGRPNTFDMDFIEWIADILSDDEYIGDSVRVVRKIYKWDELLNAVSSGEVDVAIANITKSIQREKDHNNMKFTIGYRENHQRIIFSHDRKPKLVDKELTKGELEEVLNNTTLATQDNTINKNSAMHLNETFKFKHKYHYSSYVDVIDEVRRGKVDFGMIDSVRLDTVDYPDVSSIQFNLNPILKKMYQKMSSSNVESYAIAVHTDSSNSKLLSTLDTIIRSDSWKNKREEILKTHSATNNNNKAINYSCSPI